MIASGSAIRPSAGLSLGELARLGPDELDTALAEKLYVRLRRRVLPHSGVHRGRDEERPSVGESRLREDVVRETVRELCERVRRKRCDRKHVGSHKMRVELARRLGTGERLEGMDTDEALGLRGRDRDDIVAVLHEETDDLAGLIGRNAPGDPDQYFAHRPSPDVLGASPDGPSTPLRTGFRLMLRRRAALGGSREGHSVAFISGGYGRDRGRGFGPSSAARRLKASF